MSHKSIHYEHYCYSVERPWMSLAECKEYAETIIKIPTGACANHMHIFDKYNEIKTEDDFQKSGNTELYLIYDNVNPDSDLQEIYMSTITDDKRRVCISVYFNPDAPCCQDWRQYIRYAANKHTTLKEIIISRYPETNNMHTTDTFLWRGNVIDEKTKIGELSLFPMLEHIRVVSFYR